MLLENEILSFDHLGFLMIYIFLMLHKIKGEKSRLVYFKKLRIYLCSFGVDKSKTKFNIDMNSFILVNTFCILVIA